MSYQLAAGELRTPEAEGSSSKGRDPFASIVGNSSALSATVQLARRVASRRASTVLLCGETGTGKELFARGIHYAGPVPGTPFVTVNCPAIPPQLLESELFGYERGAFTDAKTQKQGLLEVARGGTLFLDEVSSLPTDLQPKLLRALEERRVRRVGGYREIEIRCRVITATNEPLEDAVADGRFREDLFYRLNVLRVNVPPLRERDEDVLLLAEHFVGEVARTQGLASVTLTDEAAELLRAHDWPGNVRELKNVIDRAVLVSDGEAILPEHLTFHRGSGQRATSSPVSGASINIPRSGRTLASVEAEVIAYTLALTQWNKSAAARILGISRPTLDRKIERYGLGSTVRPDV